MVYPDHKSLSAHLYRRACQVMPGGNTRNQAFVPPHHLYAHRGAGCRIWDVDGVERVDFANNMTVTILGHSPPAVVSALREQAGRLTSCLLATENEIQLAELLCQRSPNFEEIRFMNTGSEAVMQMIKAARAFTGRPKIAKCEGVYHGSYDYAEVSLDPGPDNWGEGEYRSVGFAAGVPKGVLEDVVVLPFNDPDATRRILERHEDIAAIVIDLVPSRCAGIPASPAFLGVLKEYREATGTLLACDEVVSMRMAYGGAQELLGVIPDLTALGKIIGGGLPIGAVAGRAEVMAMFDSTQGKAPVPQSGTFTANPLSMVAGAVTMKTLDAESIATLNHLGDYARSRLREAIADTGIPCQVTGEASLMLLNFTDQPLSDYRSVVRATGKRQQRITNTLFYALLNRGFLITNWGLCSLSTPMGESEVERFSEAVHDSLVEIRSNLDI